MSLQAIGFDIGSLNSFVSYVTRHGIETVHDEYGDRRIPTCICFIHGRRFVGMAAKMQRQRARNNTICNFTPLLGRKYESLSLEERQSLPYVCRETIGGRVGIEVTHLGKVWILTPEQLLATQLQHLRVVTEQNTSNFLKSVVLSVPVYYTNSQRRAVRDAAHIAGISCARLVNDTTAIATAYGFCKDGSIQHGDPPQNVAFVSIGYRNTQVAICTISKGMTRILATAHDDHLGGRDFDQIIYEHFRHKLERQQTSEMDLGSSTLTQLLSDCEQLKIRMSANPGMLNICVDGFVNGRLIQFSMQRSDFETLSEHLLIRFRETILRGLNASKLKPADIHAVELVGGSCRIPALRTIAAMVFGREATTTLNADEAVARGCAIQAAMTSTAFEVHYRVMEPPSPSESRFTELPPLTIRELNDFRATELYMFHQNQEQTKVSVARNALEEYVYATKSQFEGPLKQTVTADERKLLDETESWISMTTSDCDSEAFHDRLAELRELVARVEKRHRLAKSDAIVITSMTQKPLSQANKRPSKYDQTRRSMRYTIHAPIASYLPIRDFTKPVVLPPRKPPQSVVLQKAEPPKPIEERQKSLSPPTKSPELIPKRKLVRSSTLDRTTVTGQLNCYTTHDPTLRNSMVNLIVNFFEKINDVNIQEAERTNSPRRSVSPERSPPRHRTPIYSDYLIPDEHVTRNLQAAHPKSMSVEQRQLSKCTVAPSFQMKAVPIPLAENVTQPSEHQVIKAIPILDTLRNGPEVPPYEAVVRETPGPDRQNRLLDSISDYRTNISTASRRCYEVLDRYQIHLKRQLQLHTSTHGFELSLYEKQQIESLISEANKIINEVRRHHNDTAQHLSFLDRHRDTILALTSGNGSGPQYTQQAYVRILDTFVKPICALIEEAKVLSNVLQNYETWLKSEGRHSLIRTTCLKPISRVEDTVICQLKAYKMFVWQQVSSLHTQLHNSLEQIREEIEMFSEDDRLSPCLLTLVSPQR